MSDLTEYLNCANRREMNHFQVFLVKVKALFSKDPFLIISYKGEDSFSADYMYTPHFGITTLLFAIKHIREDIGRYNKLQKRILNDLGLQIQELATENQQQASVGSSEGGI